MRSNNFQQNAITSPFTLPSARLLRAGHAFLIGGHFANNYSFESRFWTECFMEALGVGMCAENACPSAASSAS